MPDRSGMTMRVCIVNSFAGIHFETANGQHHSIRANGGRNSQRAYVAGPTARQQLRPSEPCPAKNLTSLQ